jgi:predicted ABC-type ATPase
MREEKPICYIIAGPNGAGKTTFAQMYLPRYHKSKLFVNSDLIAKGLSPFNPDAENIFAAKIMLEQIEKYASQKITFAFESTISGKTYVERIKKMKGEGYKIVLFYIMLEEVEISLRRIEERVSKGGHNIPEQDARRRFPRSAANFLNLYSPLADEWSIFDNSQKQIRDVAKCSFDGIQVLNEPLFNKLKENAKG